MANILLHDTRVDVSTPPRSDVYKPIAPNQDLERMINDIAAHIDHHRREMTDNTLNILAHGGPNGIFLGSPGLSQFNTAVFSGLYRKVSLIVFHSCAATAVYRGPHQFNGARMCEAISAVVACTVWGADTAQYLNRDRFFNATNNEAYAPWQGDLSVYTNGRLVRTNTAIMREAGLQPY